MDNLPKLGGERPPKYIRDRGGDPLILVGGFALMAAAIAYAIVEVMK